MGELSVENEQNDHKVYQECSTLNPVAINIRSVRNNTRGTFNQWIAGIVASLGMWALGSALGWSSPSVPQIEKGEGIEGITKSGVAWAASIVMLAGLPGCFLGGYMVDRVGRRRAMMLFSLMVLIGWILVAAAKTAWMLILGRAIIGLMSTGMSVAAAVYIPEMAEDRLRSRIVSWNVVALCLGILYTFIIGALVSWRWNTVISGITPIFLLVGMFFLPETPRYLLTTGKKDQASRALQWFRAQDEVEVEDELEKLVDSVTGLSGSLENVTVEKRWGANTIKPVLISVSCAAFCQLSGTSAVTFYTVDIFAAAGSSVEPSLAGILYGATQAICTAFAGLLMTRFGRRPLFIFSEAGMCVSLSILGSFYYAKEVCPTRASDLGWVPLVSLVGFTVTYCCGAGILPFALMADLCPPHVKGTASAICTAVNCGLGFLVALLFPSLLEGVGGYGAFWIFAGINALGAIYMALILPETKDKTMDEIQELFKSKTVRGRGNQIKL